MKFLPGIATLAFAAFALIQPPCVWAQATASGAAVVPMPGFEQFMVAPKITPGDVPHACAAVIKRADHPDAQAFGLLLPKLFGWGRYYFKFPSTCTDTNFLISKWQETVGHPATGVATPDDAQSLKDEIEKARPLYEAGMKEWSAPRESRFAAAKAEEQKLADDMPHTLADFLPKATTDGARWCQQRVNAAREKVQQETRDRIRALPVGSVRSAVTEGIEREAKARVLAVAPAWAALWKREPMLAQWSVQQGCNSDMRFSIEFWQATLAEPSNALETGAIARTEQLLIAAATELQQFNVAQSKRFADEAKAAGEDARTKTWALDGLSGKTKLQDALNLMPPAFCTAQGQSIVCRKVTPCSAEEQAARSTKGALDMAILTRPLDPFATSPAVGRASPAAREAQDVLKRCQMRSSYTAAARSELSFAGTSVPQAELSFDERGLATLKFNLAGDTEGARTSLTRRYGLPETQQETRTGSTSVAVGGGTAYVPGAGTVFVNPTMAQVPTQYSVTRYIWKTSSVRIEESTGLFLFRFDAK